MVSIARFIARHPLVVIALWILVAVAAGPLFAKLHEVVKPTSYSLPSSTEASKADEIVRLVTSGGGNPAIVIVDNVDLSSNETIVKLVTWARVYNESFRREGLGRNLNGFPFILASVNESVYRGLLKGLGEAARGLREGYKHLQLLNRTFLEGWVNLTERLRVLNESVYGVMVADRGFVEAYRGLSKLADAAKMVVQGLRFIDSAGVNATDKLVALAENITGLSERISMLDSAASRLYVNVSSVSRMLYAVFTNRTLLETVYEGYALAWWQVSRAYRYLEAFNGNYTLYARAANLSDIDPRLAPLPRDEAIRVWLAVKRLVEQGVDVDNASLRVAEAIVSERLGRLSQLAPVFTGLYWEGLLAVREARHVSNLTGLYSLNASIAAQSQLLVLSLAREAAGIAVNATVARAEAIVVQLVYPRLVTLGVPGELARRLVVEAVEGRVNATDFALAALAVARAEMGVEVPAEAAHRLAKVIAEYDPTLEARLASSRKLAVEAAAEFLVSMGVPRNLVYPVAKVVEEKGVDRSELAKIAWRLVEEKAAQLNPQAASLVPVVEKVDPDATGVLLRDERLLVETASSILVEQAERMGREVPSDVVRELVEAAVEDRLSKSMLVELALRLVEREAAGRVGAEKARMIVELLERFDPVANCSLCSFDAALHAILEAMREKGVEMPVNETVIAEMLREPGRAKSLYCNLFREEALKRAPREARDLVEKALGVLCEEWGVGAEDAWRLLRDYALSSMPSKVGNFTLPSWLKPLLVDASVRIARNESRVETEAARLATLVVLREVAPRLLDEMKGLMVSRSLDGFLIVFNPSGSTTSEKAKVTLRAAELANETLRGYLSGFRVYATGSDLMMKEVREYAIHDAEKTSKISEAATFIVLLVILESLLAVLLPYLGIGLGLVAGGALVYLAAKTGILTVSTEAQSLMITTALGLGADYAGYIVHRFREEYVKTSDPRRAAEEALRRAGPAVLASALTVIIGFGSLLLGWELGFLRSIGETIPVTIAATAAASLTLVPALLALVGGRSWFWWPRRPRLERVVRDSRFMHWLARHHRAVLAILTLLVVVAGYYYVNFQGSHDLKLMLPENAETVKTFRLLEEKYMPGVVNPVFIAVKLPENVYNNPSLADALHQLAETVKSISHVGKVIEPNITTKTLISSDGRAAVIQVILSVDPYSRTGIETVREIHDVAHREAERLGLTVYVGGVPYAMLELDEMLRHLFYGRILPAQAVLMILVFTAIFGALPVSIAAFLVILGAAMMGVTLGMIVFAVLYNKPIVWFLHIVALAAVLGVGMDYNSFFLARALEECRRMSCEEPEKPLARAAGTVSRFIIGLSLVVAAAYLSMLTASNVGMREMGFVLGTTVLIAGLMASYLYTPLVVALLGHHAWWPRGMKKQLEH